MRALLGVLLLLVLSPSAAQAFVIETRGGLESGGNGIAVGPDGNLWVVDAGVDKVVRMRPDGEVLARFSVGKDPTSVTTGPGGRVWVSVTGADKLVWFDATAPAPSAHDVDLSAASNCGPVAVEAGNNGRIYFSLPNDGSGVDGCTNPDRIGYVKDDGTGVPVAADRGRAYDLVVHGGKLFAPLIASNTIQRLSLDTLAVETTVAASGSSPFGIAADGMGRIWITQLTSNTLAYFPAAQNGGTATEVTPAGGTLDFAFGIVAGADGRLYVAGRQSANIVRVDPTTLAFAFFPVPEGSPWQIAAAPDGDVWFTDVSDPVVRRFVNGRPRAGTAAVSGVAPSGANVQALVDPRGNETTVVFEYGTTGAYGQATAPVTLAKGAGPVPVAAALSGLSPGTTYHLRVKATNAEGETLGDGVTFTTAPAPPPPPPSPPVTPLVPKPLGANAIFRGRRSGRATTLRVRVVGLEGGETIRISCRGPRCPFRVRTYRNVKAGSRSFDRLFGRRRLVHGVRVEVRITKPGRTGRAITASIRARRSPRISRLCLPPGSKPTRC